MNKSYQNSFCKPSTHQYAVGSILGLVIALAGCATTGSTSVEANKDDPYENFNRKSYNFNNTVDTYVTKPVSDAYKYVTPEFMQTGVSNFFGNLQSINVVLNDLLQAKFDQGAHDTGRFLMNSTLGMAGLFDVAKTVGLDSNDEDFEQTLAVWGVPQGSYLVLPFLGPITTRGIPGAVFDTAANPINYLGVGLGASSLQAISLVNKRANAEGSLKFIDEASLDPYIFTRESFLQWRNHLATDGKTDPAAASTDLDVDLLDDDKSASTKPAANNAATVNSKTVDSRTPADTSKPVVDKKNNTPILPPTEPNTKK
jgi:phospholipid-binding lipoprotein MlaA